MTTSLRSRHKTVSFGVFCPWAKRAGLRSPSFSARPRKEALPPETSCFSGLIRCWTRGFAPRSLRASRRADASDIRQEVLLRVDGALPRFEGRTKSAFLNWLRTIADHELLQILRDHGRIKRRYTAEVPWEGDDSESGNAADALAVRGWPSSEPDESEFLDQALELVSEEKAYLFILKYRDGLECEEIARQAGIPSATLRKQLRRIAADLAERITLLRTMRELELVPLQKRAICLSRFRLLPTQRIAELLRIPPRVVDKWLDEARARGLLDRRDTP